MKPTTPKTRKRNTSWRFIIMQRARYLIKKYGYIICEYSGETISVLSSTGEFEEGWGHHIDQDRNNCTPENCYIVKYKYHSLIHDKNIQVRQEGFEGGHKPYNQNLGA